MKLIIIYIFFMDIRSPGGQTAVFFTDTNSSHARRTQKTTSQ